MNLLEDLKDNSNLNDSFLEISIYIDYNLMIHLEECVIYNVKDKSLKTKLLPKLTENYLNKSFDLNKIKHKEMTEELYDIEMEKYKSIKNDLEKIYYNFKEYLMEYLYKIELITKEIQNENYNENIKELTRIFISISENDFDLINQNQNEEHGKCDYKIRIKEILNLKQIYEEKFKLEKEILDLISKNNFENNDLNYNIINDLLCNAKKWGNSKDYNSVELIKYLKEIITKLTY